MPHIEKESLDFFILGFQRKAKGGKSSNNIVWFSEANQKDILFEVDYFVEVLIPLQVEVVKGLQPLHF